MFPCYMQILHFYFQLTIHSPFFFKIIFVSCYILSKSIIFSSMLVQALVLTIATLTCVLLSLFLFYAHCFSPPFGILRKLSHSLQDINFQSILIVGLVYHFHLTYNGHLTYLHSLTMTQMN